MDITYRYDTFAVLDPRKVPTAEAAIQALADGNARFRDIASRVQAEVLGGAVGQPVVIPVNPLTLGFPLVAGKPPAQSPFAIILGCSDARAPIERVLDHSHNELFIVRVAGNVLGTECLGSVEYASRNFASSVKAVVVLGHTGCGAIAAAVDLYLDPEAYGAIAETHALRTIIDRILVVVRVAALALNKRCGPTAEADPGYRQALWEMGVYLNAALTAHDLAREIQHAEGAGHPVMFGVYDLASQKVASSPDENSPAFAPAPKTAKDFATLAEALTESVLSCGVIRPEL
jgi:carbonic anhydrase